MAVAVAPRVLHVVPALFRADGGVLGGAERYARELARYMAREVPTELLTFGSRAGRERVDDLDITVLGAPWHVRGQASNPVSLAMFKHLRRATIVHCHQQHVLTSSLAAGFCRMTRRRVFVTDLGGGGWDVSAYVSTDRWFHGHLHISEYSRRVFGHAGKPWAHVISGGVDTERFSPGSRKGGGESVLYVGRLVPHKGVDYLIEGLPDSMSLEIIGQPYDTAFVARLRSLAAGKQVTFRHDCSDDDLVAAYRRALCVVLPSVYRTAAGEETKVPELLGQAALEAMACGVPVVCTNVASLPEVVEDGVTGLHVPPNDPRALGEQLARLAGRPEEACTMGAAGRDRVLERFTWPATVRRCLAVYTQFDSKMAALP